MNRVAMLVLVALTGACSSPPEKPREICANGKDDDSNGFTDCQDPDCAGQSGCLVAEKDGGGNFGTCKQCGKTCAKQSDCLTLDYQNDTPLPECVGGKCERLNANVQVSFELDTSSLNGFMPPIRSLNTRIISRRAVDGSAVTCALVRAAAMGKTEADAPQIEKSGKFNLRGYDVSPVQASPGEILKQPFVNVGTGGEFLIWTEVWGGQVATATKLPTGNRYSWGCFDMGTALAPVVASDNCGTDAGVCRTMKVKLVNGPE